MLPAMRHLLACLCTGKISLGVLRRHDGVVTYDGRLILSERAVDELEPSPDRREIHLIELEHTPSVYYALPTRVIAFDSGGARRRLRGSLQAVAAFGRRGRNQLI
jgi:hypothetical protein